jgi:hypothetical protein
MLNLLTKLLGNITKKRGRKMDFIEAIAALGAGKKIRLPHWKLNHYLIRKMTAQKVGDKDLPKVEICYFYDEKAVTTAGMSDEERAHGHHILGDKFEEFSSSSIRATNWEAFDF